MGRQESWSPSLKGRETKKKRGGGNTGERDEKKKKRCPGEVSSSGIIQTEREGGGDLIHWPFTQASARTLSLSRSVLDSFFWTLSLLPFVPPFLPPSLFKAWAMCD